MSLPFDDDPAVRLAALLEGSPVGMIELRFDALTVAGIERGVARVVNPAAQALLGCGPAPAPLDALWPASRPALTPIAERLVAGDGACAQLPVDIAQRRILLSARRVPDRPALWLTLVDGTAERAAEDRAALAELDLHQSQSVAGLGSYVWIVGTDTARWSPQLHALLETEEPSFETFVSRIHPDDVERTKIHVGGVLEGTNADPVLEYRLVLPSGRERWVRDAFAVERAPDGTPLRLVGTTLDITTVKQSERALAHALARSRADAARLRAAFDQAAVGIALIEPLGGIVQANAGLGAILGREAEALEGRLIGDLFDDAGARAIGAQLASVASGADRGWAPLDLEAPRADGGAAWVRVTFAPIDEPAAAPVGFMVVLEDRTAQREAERLAASFEQQLLQAQKLDAIGRLAGGVAHDFNNILQIVQLNLDLLEIGGGADPQEPLQVIGAAVERATSIVQQLLAFGRRGAEHPEPLDLVALVVGSVRMLRSWLEERVQITLTTAPESVGVRADRGMIEQVVLNLCVNARDAMPEGGLLHIDVRSVDLDIAFCRAHPWARVGRFARLTVEDGGHGIPPELIERVWEPFFTTRPPGQGTGLGLATVYGIVSRHQGMIALESTVGAGTRVAIHLPIEEGSPIRTEAPEGAPGVGRGETILVAEDDPTLRRMIVQVLSGAGYRVLAAADGDQAVAIACAHPGVIDLAVLDVVMPGQSGLSAARALAALRPRLRTLFSTGHGLDALTPAEHLPPAFEVIRKPYGAMQLLTRVSAALARPRGHD